VLTCRKHYSFFGLRQNPAQVRRTLERIGSSGVCRLPDPEIPIHGAHEELTKRAAEMIGGSLLIHPVVGLTRPGDVDFYTRVRCYKALVERYYDPARTVLSLLPARHADGWTARSRLARDHPEKFRRETTSSWDAITPGPARDASGRPFYGAYDAQRIAVGARG